MLSVIKCNINGLYYATNLKYDYNFMLEAAKYDINVLKYASIEIKNNKEFMLNLLSFNILTYRFLPHNLKIDKDIIYQIKLIEINIHFIIV